MRLWERSLWLGKDLRLAVLVTAEARGPKTASWVKIPKLGEEKGVGGSTGD